MNEGRPLGRPSFAIIGLVNDLNYLPMLARPPKTGSNGRPLRIEAVAER